MRQERKRSGTEGWNARKPKTPEGATAERVNGKLMRWWRGYKRERRMCVLRDTVAGTLASERTAEGGKGGRRARFLVYRGINPYPQLPFVLGAAWSTC